ncbi:hypothetical protein QJQ45_005936 [Haematococcus lacustris]|nr:hypothetical protein QJQ45_005936 [Haematococcus lacustris]
MYTLSWLQLDHAGPHSPGNVAEAPSQPPGTPEAMTPPPPSEGDSSSGQASSAVSERPLGRESMRLVPPLLRGTVDQGPVSQGQGPLPSLSSNALGATLVSDIGVTPPCAGITLPEADEELKYKKAQEMAGLVADSHLFRAKDRNGKTESQCLEPSCKREVTPGMKSCPECLFKRRDRQERAQAKRTSAQNAWRQHKSRAMLAFGLGSWLQLNKYTALMFPAGPNGPRATCVELVTNPDDPDGPLKLCGGYGTVNRIMSKIQSYSHKDQRCNVLCHKHNANHEGRCNGELATAAMAATAAAKAAKAPPKAPPKAAKAAKAAKAPPKAPPKAAKAPPKPGSSKGCPIELD